jgi:hypothetical protein
MLKHQRHGSLPALRPMVTDHVTDDYPTAAGRDVPPASVDIQGRTSRASSTSAPKRTISSWLFRSAS